MSTNNNPNRFRLTPSLPKSTFLIKQKSLSSLHHKHPSHTDILTNSITQRQQHKSKLALTYRLSLSKLEQQQSDTDIEKKNDEITLLKRKLDTALNMAISEKIQASTKKEQVFKDEKTRQWYQAKIIELQNIIIRERQLLKVVTKEKKISDDQLIDIQKTLAQKHAESAIILQQNKQITELTTKISHLTLLNKDIDVLKQRIKTLEDQIRKEKIQVKDNTIVLQKMEKQRDNLMDQLRLQRPKQEELKQHIAYLERVNLDLSRKMEDYDRRENEYIRNANNAKNRIKKLNQEKTQLQDKLFDTSKSLGDKVAQCQSLKIESQGKSVVIGNLERELQAEKQKVIKLLDQLQATKDFYKMQEQQNIELKRKNHYLLEHQGQYERVMAHFQKVNDEINLTIITRSEEIKKLHGVVETLEKHSTLLEEKYLKFEVLFEDRTEKGDNEISEFFYLHLRENAKLKLQFAQLKTELAQKVLKFGEERDTWNKNALIRSAQTPSDQQLFGSLYRQKNEELILLEGSNDQLLKIKKQLQQRIRELENQVEEQRKQSIALKLKASEVFRAKKEVDQARKTMDRYQQMIGQQSQTIKDLESQLVVLRDKINILNQKNFHLDLTNKNNLIKINELQEIMTEINADVLIQKKTKNDMNAHMISDSLEKLQNGVKALEFYFSCSFCGQISANPITISPCGHTFCQKPKCKEAYGEFCFECDTGMPIENVFANKYMKEAVSKFRFFKIVIDEATTNVKSLLKSL